jgi:hypothetical protein
LGLLLFPSGIRGAVNSGDVIVSNAIRYLGRPYVLGAPTNKEEEYGGGGIFSVEGEYTGGFDCSGLVSWCAGLRRHYFTSELPTLTDSIGWGSLQPGDLLLGSGHVLIFEKWVQKEGTNTWKVRVIHAVSKLQIGTETIDIKKVERRDLTISFLKSKNWLPCRFKNDTKPPIVKFDGAENEKHYKHNVTLTINGRDYIEGPTYAYGLYKEKKFKTKTFKEEGKYEIIGKAIDWAGNEKKISRLPFCTDRIPPEVESTTHPKR